MCTTSAAVYPCLDSEPIGVVHVTCSWLTRGYLGWRGVLAVYAFFCGAGALQRWVGGREGGWPGVEEG